MKNIVAIDPGNEQSGVVVWDGDKLGHTAIWNNAALVEQLGLLIGERRLLAVEMIASYGMPVGKEVFDTCVWVGRFIQQWKHLGGSWVLVKRADVKLHHCHNMRAKDSNIRMALIDKYGAPGTKKNPGGTYGLKKDLWQAFALATYVSEMA